MGKMNPAKIPANEHMFAPVVNPQRGLRVHVSGLWCGCQYTYYSTSADGIHTLKTPKTNKILLTRSQLLHTRKRS